MILVWLQVLCERLHIISVTLVLTTPAAKLRRLSSSQRRSTNTARVQKLPKKVLESVRISQIMLGAPEATKVPVIQPADSDSICSNFIRSVGCWCLQLPVYGCRLRFVCQSSDLSLFENSLLWKRLPAKILNLPPETALPGADGRSRPACCPHWR